MPIVKTMPALAGVTPTYSVVTNINVDYNLQIIRIKVSRYLASANAVMGGPSLSYMDYEFSFTQVDSAGDFTTLIQSGAEQIILGNTTEYTGATIAGADAPPATAPSVPPTQGGILAWLATQLGLKQ